MQSGVRGMCGNHSSCPAINSSTVTTVLTFGSLDFLLLVKLKIAVEISPHFSVQKEIPKLLRFVCSSGMNVALPSR
jgi:hypothetical protein